MWLRMADRIKAHLQTNGSFPYNRDELNDFLQPLAKGVVSLFESNTFKTHEIAKIHSVEWTDTLSETEPFIVAAGVILLYAGDFYYVHTEFEATASWEADSVNCTLINTTTSSTKIGIDNLNENLLSSRILSALTSRFNSPAAVPALSDISDAFANAIVFELSNSILFTAVHPDTLGGTITLIPESINMDFVPGVSSKMETTTIMTSIFETPDWFDIVHAISNAIVDFLINVNPITFTVEATTTFTFTPHAPIFGSIEIIRTESNGVIALL